MSIVICVLTRRAKLWIPQVTSATEKEAHYSHGGLDGQPGSRPCLPGVGGWPVFPSICPSAGLGGHQHRRIVPVPWLSHNLRGNPRLQDFLLELPLGLPMVPKSPSPPSNPWGGTYTWGLDPHTPRLWKEDYRQTTQYTKNPNNKSHMCWGYSQDWLGMHMAFAVMQGLTVRGSHVHCKCNLLSPSSNS